MLRNLLLALDKLIAFTGENKIAGDWNFAIVFINLISSRPSVCAETMDRFADLRSLGIRTVYKEFQTRLKEDSSTPSAGDDVAITIRQGHKEKELAVSLSLLQSASVLLSLWTESNGASSELTEDRSSTRDLEDKEAKVAVDDLANMLLHSIDVNNKDGVNEKGFASAKFIASGKSAVSVESVSSMEMKVCHCLPFCLSISDHF